ncbi:MAG: hypothetical protein HQK92_13025, partial [Nitrospirae bacterium]|nr:hypothetical protein [Nitrospirota bacterium]
MKFKKIKNKIAEEYKYFKTWMNGSHYHNTMNFEEWKVNISPAFFKAISPIVDDEETINQVFNNRALLNNFNINILPSIYNRLHWDATHENSDTRFPHNGHIFNYQHCLLEDPDKAWVEYMAALLNKMDRRVLAKKYIKIITFVMCVIIPIK